MKLFYLRSASGQRVVCVASKQIDDVVWFAISTWNPRDRFDRRTAREYAYKRLNERQDSVSSRSPDVRMAICQRIANEEKWPDRARRAARLELERWLLNLARDRGLRSALPSFYWGRVEQYPILGGKSKIIHRDETQVDLKQAAPPSTDDLIMDWKTERHRLLYGGSRKSSHTQKWTAKLEDRP